MKILLDQAIQQTVNFTQLQHHCLRTAISRVSQAIQPITAVVQAIVLITSLVLGSVLLIPMAPAYAQGAMLTPRQVVEYALTLEKLEADFYRRGVEAAQSGGLASAPQVAKDAIVSYGEDEAQHVTDLSMILTSLGGDPNTITIPADPNYTAILKRDPFANPADFLLAGQYVEDLGVAAYKGQAGNLLAAGAAAKPILAGALEIHSVEARHAAGIRFLRQTLLSADVQPWIRDSDEVIYLEERSGTPIPFDSEAFDGFATSEEVLALVGPILGMENAPMMPANKRRSTMLKYGEHPKCNQNRVVLDYFTNYLYKCIPPRDLSTG